jgi:enamine deaminase RidA (YjgF/YER057c/UK114 family)
MASVCERIEASGLSVPDVATPIGSYVPAVRAGGLVFTSGQLPLLAGELLFTGVVGRDVGLQDAQDCARQCVLNALAAAATVCQLDDVVRVVKLVGYVASAESFSAQPAVINGASDVLVVAFGQAGRHAREAVGVAALPMGAPVEISLVLELRQGA